MVLKVKPSDIAYLRGTVESYDGMAVVRTIDPSAALIELQISPGCEGLVLEILDHLAKYENLDSAPIKASAKQIQNSNPSSDLEKCRTA